jgi:anaerobic ribonucleoside-triphosphate reductase activating protein
MLSYFDCDIYLNEIPKEISLGISFTGCPIHCEGCHWEPLWDDRLGTPFTYEALSYMLERHDKATCVLFMGGEWDSSLINFIKYVKGGYPEKKTALYSGQELAFFEGTEYMDYLDYLKVGPYMKELGGLQSPNTNQRLFKLDNGEIEEDLTLWLQKNTAKIQ